VGHELRHQLDGGAQADAQQTHQVGVLHAGHDQGLLGERRGEAGQRGTKKVVAILFIYIYLYIHPETSVVAHIGA